MNEKYEYAKALSALAVLERERVNLATRCEQLEQLCRDMDKCRREPKCCNCEHYGEYECRLIHDSRLDALGLLEGEQ